MREEGGETRLARGGEACSYLTISCDKNERRSFFCSNCFLVCRLPRVLGLLYNEAEQNPALWASWEQSSTSGPIKISGGTFCNLVTP